MNGDAGVYLNAYEGGGGAVAPMRAPEESDKRQSAASDLTHLEHHPRPRRCAHQMSRATAYAEHRLLREARLPNNEQGPPSHGGGLYRDTRFLATGWCSLDVSRQYWTSELH